MNNVAYNKKGTIKYLVWTFLIAWVMQVVAAVLYRNGIAIIVWQSLVGIMMFVPLLAVILSGQSLSGMGWKPCLKGKIKLFLAAWFLPALLTAIGAALYFAVFPGHFDMSGDAFAAAAGADALEQMQSQGLTYSMYVVSAVIGCMRKPIVSRFRQSFMGRSTLRVQFLQLSA